MLIFNKPLYFFNLLFFKFIIYSLAREKRYLFLCICIYDYTYLHTYVWYNFKKYYEYLLRRN
jgi:hypothetical protein